MRRSPARRLHRLASAVTAATATTAAALSGATAAHAQQTHVRIAAAPPAAPAPSPAAVSGAPRVVYGPTELAVKDAKRAAFRDPIDGEVCVAPEALAPLGVAYMIDRRGEKVTLTAADSGKTVTVEVREAPDEYPNDGPFVPAVEALEALGAKCEFDQKANVLHVRAVLTGVEMLGGQLRVKSSLPIAAKVSTSKDRKLILVDVPGAEVGDLPKTLDLQSPGVIKARTGQFDDDTARVVLEMEAPSGFFQLGGDRPTTLLTLNPVPDRRDPAASVAQNDSTPSKPTTPAPVAKKANGGSPAPTYVRGVAFRRVSDTRAQIVVSAGSAPAVRAALDRGRLTFDFLNATFAADAGSSLASAEHPFLKGVQLIARGATGQLLIDLTRTVNFQVRMNPGGGLTIDLGLPRGAGGKLAGKLIVVDAGHGGSDSGARGVNGTYEKNVNLAIARRLADELRDRDVNVILTRDADTFIPLGERSFIANRAGADFFVSVHADSGDSNHSARGSGVFYHLDEPSCKSLARCIASRLGDLGGIPTRGVRSDGIRFPGVGYSVLRRSQMVSVLVETGFMTNPTDARLLNDRDMQGRIANAIADGLKDYVEGNPSDFDTRFINPQRDGGTGGISLAAPAPPAVPGESEADAPSAAPRTITLPAVVIP